MTASVGTRRSGARRGLVGSDFDVWLGEVRDLTFRIARARNVPHDDAADVAQEVTEYALRRGAILMQKYRRPKDFVNARFRHGHVSWIRSQRVQRSEGVRNGRPYGSLDVTGPDGGSDLADRLAGLDDTEVAAFERLLAREVRTVLVERLDPAVADALIAVKGAGWTVTEMAEQRGVARETESRRIAGAVGTVHDDLARIVV